MPLLEDHSFGHGHAHDDETYAHMLLDPQTVHHLMILIVHPSLSLSLSISMNNTAPLV